MLQAVPVHPSSSQDCVWLHRAGREMQLRERLGAVRRGCFAAGWELIIEQMKIWKTSPGVVLQI